MRRDMVPGPPPVPERTCAVNHHVPTWIGDGCRSRGGRGHGSRDEHGRSGWASSPSQLLTAASECPIIDRKLDTATIGQSPNSTTSRQNLARALTQRFPTASHTARPPPHGHMNTARHRACRAPATLSRAHAARTARRAIATNHFIHRGTSSHSSLPTPPDAHPARGALTRTQSRTSRPRNPAPASPSP